MVSTRTASCSSPRALTLKESVPAPGATRMETLYRVSFSRRAFIWRLVTSLPSVPARGEVLMEKSMDMVGSSTLMAGRGRGSSGSARVSPIKASSTPATAAMSPALISWADIRSRPW